MCIKKSGRVFAISALALFMACLSFVAYTTASLLVFAKEGSFRVYWGWFTWHGLVEGLFFAWPLWIAAALVARQFRLVPSIICCAVLGCSGVVLHYFLVQQQTPEGFTIWVSSDRLIVVSVLFAGLFPAAMLTRGLAEDRDDQER